jgi:hypothetical protein
MYPFHPDIWNTSDRDLHYLHKRLTQDSTRLFNANSTSLEVLASYDDDPGKVGWRCRVNSIMLTLETVAGEPSLASNLLTTKNVSTLQDLQEGVPVSSRAMVRHQLIEQPRLSEVMASQSVRYSKSYLVASETYC